VPKCELTDHVGTRSYRWSTRLTLTCSKTPTRVQTGTRWRHF